MAVNVNATVVTIFYFILSYFIFKKFSFINK